MAELFDFWHKNGNSLLTLDSSAQRASHNQQEASDPPIADELCAVLYYVGEQGIDLATLALEIRFSTGAANMRMGVYSCQQASSKLLYPQTLIADFGEVALAPVGQKTWTANQQLPAGMYWIAWNVSATTCRWSRLETQGHSDVYSYLGSDGTSGVENGSIYVAHPYGALPATFPAGAAVRPTSTSPPVPFLVMKAASATLAAPALPTTGLIADWRLDGNLLDSYGPNNGTSAGTPVYGAGLFSGTQAYDCQQTTLPNMGTDPSLVVTTAFTLSFWYNLTTPQGNRGFATKGDLASNYGDWTVCLQGPGLDKIGLFLNNASFTMFSPKSAIQGNVWQHVAVTYDQVNGKIYEGGSLSATSAYTLAVTNNYSMVKLASMYQTSAYTPVGYMQNIGYWNRALTAEEIFVLSRPLSL
jgi:hypothetical protein